MREKESAQNEIMFSRLIFSQKKKKKKQLCQCVFEIFIRLKNFHIKKSTTMATKNELLLASAKRNEL